MQRPNYEAYLEHALVLNEHEERLREELMPALPDDIVDSHTHTSVPSDFDYTLVPERIHQHMMSTYPTFTIEQSNDVDKLLFPGKTLSKARFAHVFAGVDKRAVNEYLVDNCSEKDYSVLFGISDTPAEVDYTINEIESGKFRALKMYYLANDPPKYGLFEYFPRSVLAAAQKAEMPIILHLPHSLYKSQNEVDQLATEFPNLNIILAHVGVANLPKPELDTILAGFAEHPNVFVDTALVDVEGIALKALQHLGHKRVLYGSDEPLNLLRTVTYYNPELETARVLTDFPYHWADIEEQTKYRSFAEKPFVHNHWLQLKLLIGAIATTSSSPAENQKHTEAVFRENAVRLFGSK